MFLLIAIVAGVLALAGIIADVVLIVTSSKDSSVGTSATPTPSATATSSPSTSPDQTTTPASTSPSSTTPATTTPGTTEPGTTTPGTTAPGTTAPGTTSSPGNSTTVPGTTPSISSTGPATTTPVSSSTPPDTTTSTSSPTSSTFSPTSSTTTPPVTTTTSPGTTTSSSTTTSAPTTTQAATTTSAPTTAPPAGYVWKPLRTGAGGWIVGLHIHPSGSPVLSRTDVGGAYRWDEASATWTQLITTMSMGAGATSGGYGVFALVSAPSNANRLYMAGVGNPINVYRSDNKGDTWTVTALTGLPDDSNGNGRQCGERLAVDPANKDIVYYGSGDGKLRVSTNAGASWIVVSAFSSIDSQFGITAVTFDPATTAGTQTNTIYAVCSRCGIWRSTNAGSSWSKINGGGPGDLQFAHAIVVSSVLYISGPGGAWKFNGGTWTDISGGNTDIWSIAVNPTNPQHILLFAPSGAARRSLNGGASYTDLTLTRSATDIPWLAWTDEGYMSNGNTMFDPVVANRIWFAQGIGMWRATDNTGSTTLAWNSVSRGIEQLVSNDVVVPVSGKPVTAHWDRPVFYHADLDAFPSQHGITNRFNAGWDVAVAGNNPTFVVASVYDMRGCCSGWSGPDDQSGYSTDGGQTWTSFSGRLPDLMFGDIAVAATTTTNIVRLPSNNKAPYWSNDRGASWNMISLPGVALAGSHAAYYLRRNVLTADWVADNTFYLYHDDSNSIFVSADGGRNWNKKAVPSTFPTFSNKFSGHWNAKMKAVPGKQGHLCFTTGRLDEGDLPMACSQDAGTTWSSLGSAAGVSTFGFGAPETAGGYPTIFIAGKINGVRGVWCTSSQGARWGQLADAPLGIFDGIDAMEGDPTLFGRVYAGFGGVGFAYGTGSAAGLCG